LGEQAALEFAQRGLPVVIASPTSPLGPGDDAPTPTGQIVQDFLAGKFPFAGPPLLNFVDVTELAAGILAVGDRGRIGERYILGGHSVWHAEFLRLLGRLTGLPAPRVTLPVWAVTAGGAIGELLGSERLNWETAVHCRKRQPFDLRKAREELGWEARVPLEDCARAAVEWFQRKAAGV
jgi:dihydroflavonol-4-reductase